MEDFDTSQMGIDDLEAIVKSRRERKAKPREYSLGEGIADLFLGGVAGAAEGLKGGTQGAQAASNAIGAKNAAIEKRMKALEDPLDIKLLTTIAGMKQKNQLSDLMRQQKEQQLAQQLQIANAGLGLKEAQLTNKQLEGELREKGKQEDKTQKEVKEFEKSTDDLYNMGASIENIEGEIASAIGKPGFKLEQYDPKTETVNGKSVDLPGVSVPGLGRVTAYSSGARSLESTIANLENQLLKARSGAAVTESEYQRMRSELARARASAEPEMIQSLSRFKNDFVNALQRKEQAFPKGAAALSERGRKISTDYRREAGMANPAQPADDAAAKLQRYNELKQKYGR